MNLKWDVRFIRLAEHVSQWSKDPSTKVGSVIVDERNRIVSVGYNGFPRGVEDTEERLNDRETKYKIVVHAEANALLFAQRDVSGFTIYNWPFLSCSSCTGKIIQAGIKRIVAPMSDNPRWADDFALATRMAVEAGVEVDLYRI